MEKKSQFEIDQQKLYDEQLKKFIKDKKANAALKAKPMAEETRFSFKDFLAEKVVSVKKNSSGNVTSAKTEPDDVYNSDVKRAFPNGKAPGVKVGPSAPKGTNTMPKDKSKMGIKLESKEQHDDTEEDKELIKKMVKPEALKEDELEESGYTGKGNHRPGWMLRADPELAKKFKEKEDQAKARQKAYGDPSKGKSVKESEELYEAKVRVDISDPKAKNPWEVNDRYTHVIHVKAKNMEHAHELAKKHFTDKGYKVHSSEVLKENSPFDWKGKSSIFTKKDEPETSAQGGTIHKARTQDRNAETGGAKEKNPVGRPKGAYDGNYKIDRAKRDTKEYKQQLAAKVQAAKKEGFAARDEFKKHMHDAILRHQLRTSGIDPKDHEAQIAKKNPVKK